MTGQLRLISSLAHYQDGSILRSTSVVPADGTDGTDGTHGRLARAASASTSTSTTAVSAYKNRPARNHPNFKPALQSVLAHYADKSILGASTAPAPPAGPSASAQRAAARHNGTPWSAPAISLAGLETYATFEVARGAPSTWFVGKVGQLRSGDIKSRRGGCS